MPAMTPGPNTLLRAAADYLEHDLMPTLAGYHRFQTRISINVLRTVMRELELGAAQDAAAHARLTSLLGHDGDTGTLNRELADAIDSGLIDTGNPELVAHLRHTLRDALAINSPKWIESDPA